MNPALGPYAIAALLLVVAGVLKAARPDDTTRALREMGIPATGPLVRVGGGVEVLLGLAGLVGVGAGAAVALLVAASYAFFVAFVAVALATHRPISTCGCFGKLDTPPTRVHLGVSVGACVAAIAMAVDASTAPVDVLDRGVAESVSFAVLVGAGTLAAFAAMTWLPQALTAPPRARKVI